MRRAAFLFLFLLAAAAATAADMKVEARLVCGANDQKTVANGKPVDEALSAKLHGTFKWKYYFEITNQSASIPINKTRELKLSDQCAISIKNLGGSRVEINCTGEGNQSCKGAYTLTPPKWLVLGGHAKGDTAWFVGLRTQDAKPGDTH